MSVRIIHVVGARPNFMKIAPVMRALSAAGPGEFDQKLVHTGQHYHETMSGMFFADLGLRRPDHNLAAGSGSHAKQTAKIMVGFEALIDRLQPDWVVVPGDVNSTLAASLVAAKQGVPLAHVEAGLRSFDSTMPEEINRVVADRLATLLFTPSRDADYNLAREGVDASRIHFVGNVMIDSLVALLPQAQERWPRLRDQFGLERYVLVTLHRPSNVDDPETFSIIERALHEIALELPVVFPMHPRTRGAVGAHTRRSGLRVVEPLGYLDFLALEAHAAVVLTDSGGIQEETTYLGVPCLTLRTTTERPVTLTHGTNRLVALDRAAIVDETFGAAGREPERSEPPELWDGHAAERIADVFRDLAQSAASRRPTAARVYT